jgi:hypothetical protein
MLWPNSSDAWRNAQQSLTKFGFSHECILRAHWDEKLAFFCQILLSADHRTRMVVHFPVTFCEHSSPSVMLYSIATNGEMIITDNCYGTFGGYYPSSWDVDRRPLLRSIDRLHALHSRRLNGRSLLKLLAPALSSLNMMQKSIIDENLMRNFFLVVQENGGNLLRLADEAGFRVWAEMFLLKYFGRSLS